MVAVIKAGNALHRILAYNENKVKAGVAACIGAENYPLDACGMTGKIKLGYLLMRVKLNGNVKRNSVHISLNFHPSETHLGKERLLRIARVYMHKLGFGEQPYLVYQHHDAGHPHLHLVTTNIQPDGKRIDLHHLGIRKSEPARKEIEKMFGLIVADARARREVFRPMPVDVKKVQYGRSETKSAIANVLGAVLNKYRYTSLPELNAVLQLYNIKADRGGEESRIFKGGGLVYRILDETGKPIGVPIKASDFYSKPTLKFLEEKYSANDAQRQPFKARVKNEIDRLFIDKKPTLEELVLRLQRKGIHVALRRSDTGLIYGITYVDHQTKCIFNGSALGKPYSAKAMQERCRSRGTIKPNPPSGAIHVTARSTLIGQKDKAGPSTALQDKITTALALPEENMLEALLQPEQPADYIPGQLRKKSRKKKKRKSNSHNP